MPSISIAIAAHNEEASLEKVYRRSLSVLKRCTDDYEIVMIDDGSSDSTFEIMQRLRARHPENTLVMRHERNLGIARTFEAACRAATKDFVLDVPGDGEYPPEVLEDMLPLLDRYDLIVAKRTRKDYSLYRRFVSTSYRLLPRLFFGVDLFDPGSIKCRRRALIHEITPRSKSVFKEAERAIRATRRGHRLGYVPIDPEPREGGRPGGAKPALVLQSSVDLLATWIRLTLVREAP